MEVGIHHVRSVWSLAGVPDYCTRHACKLALTSAARRAAVDTRGRGENHWRRLWSPCRLQLLRVRTRQISTGQAARRDRGKNLRMWNKKIANDMTSAYRRCCQNNGRWLLRTAALYTDNSWQHLRCDDGHALFTTAAVWRQVEKEVVLTCENIYYLKPEYLLSGASWKDLNVIIESAEPTSVFYIVDQDHMSGTACRPISDYAGCHNDIRPVQAVTEDTYIRTVWPRRSVICFLTAPYRNILTYLFTYL